MGRQSASETRFRERVRDERERRKWSQADLAKMLKDKGIHSIYPTTIAKIESGERAVRIDEAAAIADLFDVSLDVLMGLRGVDDDAAYALTVLADEAQQLTPAVVQIRDRLRRAYRQLEAQFDFADFDERLADEDVAGGQMLNLGGLSLEHRRAFLMWVQKELALNHFAALLDCLASVTKIRTMSAPEIGRRVKTDRALAAIARQAAEERGYRTETIAD
ncbi:MAG: helix-turn-helix transcriptional regulator [Pseudolabrys sp.]